MPLIPITAGGYQFYYAEKAGSPKEMCSGDVFRAQRTFDVPYEYRWIFIKYMLGTSTLSNPGDIGDVIKREIPDQYYVYYSPEKANQKAFMVATTLEGMETLGEQKLVDDNLVGSKLYISSYKYARITIGYEAVTYDVVSDAEMGGASEYTLKRFATVFRQPTAEFLTLPQGAFKWVEDDEFGKTKLANKEPCGVPVVGANGKIISAQEIILVHHRVPGVPTAINTHIGCVNDKDWDALRAKRGQLLLSNVELKPYRWLDESKLFDITYKFKFFDPDPEASAKYPNRPRGHNWFLQYFPGDKTQMPSTLADVIPQYKLITHNGYSDIEGGKTVYKYANMEMLFKQFNVARSGKW